MAISKKGARLTHHKFIKIFTLKYGKFVIFKCASLQKILDPPLAKLSPVEASMKLSWLYSQLYPARPPARPPVKVLSSLNSAMTSKAKLLVSMVRP